jgi:hypothetical protein
MEDRQPESTYRAKISQAEVLARFSRGRAAQEAAREKNRGCGYTASGTMRASPHRSQTEEFVVWHV